MIIAIYINNLLFISKNKKDINNIKEVLNKRFNIKYLRELKTYLGI